MIIEGELVAGDRVSELGLAERLQVSRTPLRLALAQLEHEGLLESVPGGGFAVRSFSRQQVADAIELRGVLEGTAARLAAERHSGETDLGELISLVARIDRVLRPGRGGVEDFGLYVELNEQFHNELFVLADSDALQHAYERVLALPFASPSAFIMLQVELFTGWHENLTVAQHQHREMLDAIERGEGACAEAIAREHARLARINLDAALRSEHALTKLPGGTLIRLAEEPEDADVG
jgi:GntR family transcriptional regulator, vanillate catabolism transcriptional regulator